MKLVVFKLKIPISGKEEEYTEFTFNNPNEICDKLKENRDLNNFNFNIENSALSNRKIIQKDFFILYIRNKNAG